MREKNEMVQRIYRCSIVWAQSHIGILDYQGGFKLRGFLRLLARLLASFGVMKSMQ